MEISHSHTLPSVSRDSLGIGGRGEAPVSTPVRPPAAQPNATGRADNATISPPLNATTNVVPAQEAQHSQAALAKEKAQEEIEQAPAGSNPKFKNGVAAYQAASASNGVGLASSNNAGHAVFNPSERTPINIRA